jgi:hypothetical protein
LNEKEVSKITGTVKIDESHRCGKDWDSFSKLKKRSIGFFIGFCFFISYVIIGCLLLFIPVFRKLDTKQSAKTFWNTTLWGIVPVLIYPAIVVLCFVLIITIPLSFMLIMAFIPLFFVANVIGTTLIGKYIVTKFKWNIEKRHYQFLIGLLACLILSIIPLINFLFFIFVSTLGWGVFISFLFKKDLTIA